MSVLKDSECCDLLTNVTKELMKGLPARVYYSDWLADRNTPCAFASYMEIVPTIDKLEIMANRNPFHFLSLLETRIFSEVEDLYLALIERWNMRPRYYESHQVINHEYQDGFVA